MFSLDNTAKSPVRYLLWAAVVLLPGGVLLAPFAMLQTARRVVRRPTESDPGLGGGAPREPVDSTRAQVSP